MAQQKLDLTSNEPDPRTLQRIDEMLVEMYAKAGLGTKQKLDLTFNEPMHRMLGRIDEMFNVLYAALLPGTARTKFDTSFNEVWSRTLKRIDVELTNLYASSSWDPISQLGAKVAAYWDAENAGSFVLNGAQVSSWADLKTGLTVAQATTGFKPVRNATAINGRPGVVFDGIDDFLTFAGIGSQPSGAAFGDMWALARQDIPGTTAGTTSLFSYGLSGGVQLRSLRKTPVSNINRLVAFTNATAVDGLVDFTGSHVIRAITTATDVSAAIDGLAPSTSLVTPTTGTATTTFGASLAGTTQFHQGALNFVLVLNAALTAGEQTALLAFAKSRGGIA